MSRRNLVRSLAAALLAVVPGAGGLLVASTPAGAADHDRVIVALSDNGFSKVELTGRVGDQLIVYLTNPAIRQHTVTWQNGQPAEVELTKDHPYVIYSLDQAG